MKWRGRRQSHNVEDRRGQRRVSGKGGLIGLIIVLVGAYFGMDLSGVVQLGNQVVGQQSSGTVQESHQEAELSQFASVVLAETEDTWGQYFRQNGQQYIPPKLVLYRDSTRTGCGMGQAIMGPFYCPADQKVYIDLSFYDDMRHQLQAGGDFAFAYVIAHEVGHHVQNLLGISQKTQALQQRLPEKEANRISVQVELQADCLAGVWAHDVKNKRLLEEGDIEEAFQAAEAVGDDRLQSAHGHHVVPDSFTHGSSAQRLSWFRRGLHSGNPDQCNTFQ